jgi:xylulokinase
MYMGIDIGTSAVKAAVIDETGRVVDQASSPLTVSRPHPLWSEQNPADWWAATNSAVSDLRLPLRKSVRAIGLSGQMHGATLLDKNQRALRPAILWNDGRSAQQCVELEAAVPQMTAITGNRAMPGFTAPKLLWVREHEPEIFAATAKVVLPKDYVRLRMTGETASDMSDSAGTLWLDVAKRRWSDAMLSGTGLDASHMPALFEGNDITGELRAELAEAWGMPRVPVVAGGGDNAAGAIGVGVVRPGEAFLSLGTSGVLFLANDGYRPNPDRCAGRCAGRAGRRRLRVSRRDGRIARERRSHRVDRRDRRRRPFRLLGENLELRAAPAPDLPRQRGGGTCVWRGPPGPHGGGKGEHRRSVHAARHLARRRTRRSAG